MKRIFLTTIAGLSRRFNRETAKAIYYENGALNTLLYEQCVKAQSCDKIIIAAGFQYDAVMRYKNKYLVPRFNNIELLFNPYFADYGSGYSLYLALKEAEKYNPGEIIFCEGDLYVDAKSFSKVVTPKTDVLTVNVLPIEAEKSVVVYEDCSHRYKYVYDTGHKALMLPEPFLAVYNSAQIWKFCDMERLFALVHSLPTASFTGTNLDLINAYFKNIHAEHISRITMHHWINCNTIDDYQHMLKKLCRKNGITIGEVYENIGNTPCRD
ncbi:MAG: hypothetical protein LBD20_10030 [Spirochaetaceae bacterium]|nr:hypothetical protein [Spirochaetaceae bacterium]